MYTFMHTGWTSIWPGCLQLWSHIIPCWTVIKAYSTRKVINMWRCRLQKSFMHENESFMHEISRMIFSCIKRFVRVVWKCYRSYDGSIRDFQSFMYILEVASLKCYNLTVCDNIDVDSFSSPVLSNMSYV